MCWKAIFILSEMVNCICAHWGFLFIYLLLNIWKINTRFYVCLFSIAYYKTSACVLQHPEGETASHCHSDHNVSFHLMAMYRVQYGAVSRLVPAPCYSTGPVIKPDHFAVGTQCKLESLYTGCSYGGWFNASLSWFKAFQLRPASSQMLQMAACGNGEMNSLCYVCCNIFVIISAGHKWQAA